MTYEDWVWQQYAEAMARKLDEDIMYGWQHDRQPIPNTFRLRPEPRPGFIDARRSDGCTQVITEIL